MEKFRRKSYGGNNPRAKTGKGREVLPPWLKAKKIFLAGREKLSEERKQRVDELLDKYPGLKGFYWAKEKIRELYRRKSWEEATRLLDTIIFNLKSADDAELIRWLKVGGY